MTMLPEIPDFPATMNTCRCGDQHTGFDCALCTAAKVSLLTVSDILYPPYDYTVPDGELF